MWSLSYGLLINEVGSCLHCCSAYNWSSQREATRLEEAWQFTTQAVSPNRTCGIPKIFICALATMLLDRFMVQTTSLFNWWNPMLPSLESWCGLYGFYCFLLCPSVNWQNARCRGDRDVLELLRFVLAGNRNLTCTFKSHPDSATFPFKHAKTSYFERQWSASLRPSSQTLSWRHVCWMQLYARCLSVDRLWDESWLPALIQKQIWACFANTQLSMILVDRLFEGRQRHLM